MSILLIALLVTGSESDTPSPSQLTQTQITKLQHLVRRTQDRNVQLKAALGEQQQELMKAYSQFELDKTRISELHNEIIDRQRELLQNYRDLQVELRSIVGEQRFERLKIRIDTILKGNNKVQVRTEASTPRESTDNRQPSPERRTPR